MFLLDILRYGMIWLGMCWSKCHESQEGGCSFWFFPVGLITRFLLSSSMSGYSIHNYPFCTVWNVFGQLQVLFRFSRTTNLTFQVNPSSWVSQILFCWPQQKLASFFVRLRFLHFTMNLTWMNFNRLSCQRWYGSMSCCFRPWMFRISSNQLVLLSRLLQSGKNTNPNGFLPFVS